MLKEFSETKHFFHPKGNEHDGKCVSGYYYIFIPTDPACMTLIYWPILLNDIIIGAVHV